MYFSTYTYPPYSTFDLYAKSAILHIRLTSTWYYSCYMDLWAVAPGPLACPNCSAFPWPVLAAEFGPEIVLTQPNHQLNTHIWTIFTFIWTIFMFIWTIFCSFELCFGYLNYFYFKLFQLFDLTLWNYNKIEKTEFIEKLFKAWYGYTLYKKPFLRQKLVFLFFLF